MEKYQTFECKLSKVCNGVRKNLEIKGKNIFTPYKIGYYNGVEIAYGTGISQSYIVGVTFTTDLNHGLQKYNKCFCDHEIKAIRKYINKSFRKYKNEGGLI